MLDMLKMYGPSDAGQAILVNSGSSYGTDGIPRSPLLEIASFHQLTHCRLQQNAVASRANDGLHCLLEALEKKEERRDEKRLKIWVVLFWGIYAPLSSPTAAKTPALQPKA